MTRGGCQLKPRGVFFDYEQWLVLPVTLCPAPAASSPCAGHAGHGGTAPALRPRVPPGEAAEPYINHSLCTSSHLDGIGPSATPRRIVNTKHMLCLKLIIILGSHQLLVIGSPFAEITESSRVEIQPLPGSFSNEMSPQERWPFRGGQRDTGWVTAFNNRLHVPRATVTVTHKHRGCLGTPASPWQSHGADLSQAPTRPGKGRL